MQIYKIRVRNIITKSKNKQYLRKSKTNQKPEKEIAKYVTEI